jgi:hypothetical protein
VLDFSSHCCTGLKAVTVNVILQPDMKARGGGRGEYRCSSILSLTCALDGVGGQSHALAALPLGMTRRHSLYRKLGGPQEDAQNLVPSGVRTRQRPASSHLLYRLSYPGQFTRRKQNKMTVIAIGLYDKKPALCVCSARTALVSPFELWAGAANNVPPSPPTLDSTI